MTKTAISRSLFLAVVAAAVAGTNTKAAYMNENLSTYYDGYFDSQNVYGYGSASAGLSIHQHEITVAITSPLGRTAQGGTTYAAGTVDWTEFLSWNDDDYGNYQIEFAILGYCTQSHVYFQGPGDYVGVTPGPPPCQNAATATCAESNSLAPLGSLQSARCKRSTMCCTADLQVVNGYCLV